MAISNIKSGGSKKLSFGNATHSSGSSNLHGADGLQSPHVNNASDLTFKERVDTESPSITTTGDAVKILLPNGEVDESMVSMLQDNIHQAGEKLLVKPGYDTVIEYKQAVQTLLQSILPYLHKKESTIAPKRVNGEVRQRKFVLIHQVNQKLDTVLKIVLVAQKDQMKIMKALDEIKGLIINILE